MGQRNLDYAYVDTHVAVYLHDGLTKLLTKSAKQEIEAKSLLLSPMSYLEFEYLYQSKKIGIPAEELYKTIHIDFGICLCQITFAKIAAKAIALDWSRDPFDRLIVANALANPGATLITKDGDIRENFAKAIW